MKGRLFAVVGPSGAGKDTLLEGLCTAGGPHWARRVITRPSAAGGEPFEGVDAATFSRRLAAGEFALHWRAHGLSYGVPRAELAPLDQGGDVVFNGSRAALAQALAAFPELTVIEITAPPNVLAARLALRGREDAPQIAQRLKREVRTELSGKHILRLVNDATPAEGIERLRALLYPSETR